MKTRLFALCLLVVVLFTMAQPVSAKPLDGNEAAVTSASHTVFTETPHGHAQAEICGDAHKHGRFMFTPYTSKVTVICD